MMKLILFLFSIVLISCQNEVFVKIDPVDRDTIFKINSNVKNPSVLVMHVISNLDDTCKILGHRIPPNAIDTILYSDQYDPIFHIIYEAHKAKKGGIEIKYKLN